MLTIWIQSTDVAVEGSSTYENLLLNIRKQICLVYDLDSHRFGAAFFSDISFHAEENARRYNLAAILPPVYPEWLGGMAFTKSHNLRFPYVGGAMARGISSARMVISLAENGMLGFFGSGGVNLSRLESEIRHISESLDPKGLSWGANLIHTPGNPQIENDIIDLNLKLGVKRISTAAFMDIPPSIVRYACRGLSMGDDGTIQRMNHIFAKISRLEVARQFLSPAPSEIIESLLEQGRISRQEAALSQKIPICGDMDVEGDSGGHTDNRPLNSLFPSILKLKQEIESRFQYQTPIRLGAAGGNGTPESIAAAFAMGASYVVVGSVHQASVEAGTSQEAKEMLSKAGIADFAMTPSADMFEIGSRVQVLKRGTMMSVRGNQLLEAYKKYDSMEDIPLKRRRSMEKNIFNMPLEKVWEETRRYFETVEASEIRRSEKDPKYKMSLVFRWYLGNSSHWPIAGEKSRLADYQIWSGPAMGAFNQWVKGSFLEPIENRTVSQIALNLLEGAATITRINQIRHSGIPMGLNSYEYRPMPVKI
ncbi:PfaD family protein [Desulfamplus magnetovallimortis]|uniref:PfaD family protein n=1 Tax=Desulfamplus magnetovallimortis TaxID=1246637 RepID=A0A1W1HAH1_9BACT|nr:PfaD family polyunsaturated fatty acid/polyketide biosynthesis protein [Desulfamplus magnetovallimortis]SLM29481.1 PfaD family protein [Desulfamplus magnetovallimortis]